MFLLHNCLPVIIKTVKNMIVCSIMDCFHASTFKRFVSKAVCVCNIRKVLSYTIGAFT